MKGKVYIRGKVTGLPLDVYTANFKEAEEMLIKKGYSVVNPVELISKLPKEEQEWKPAMRVCIRELMPCDYYFSLDNADDSTGATLEKYIADRVGIGELIVEENFNPKEKS